MFTKLREPFGTAGLVVAIIALVFALGGGAWALTASNAGKHHLKARRHARGTRGPQGPQGPEGPEGPAGINGKNGTNGKAGTNGTNGTPGKSVVSGVEEPGENCELGGYWFELQGTGLKQYICKGGGSGGSSGGTTLAPGDTETGVWATSSKGFIVSTAISFPLRVEWKEDHSPRVIENNDSTTECPGTVPNPAAKPGYLCVYVDVLVNGTIDFPLLGEDYFPSNGVVLRLAPLDPESTTVGRGTWAATAPE